MKTRLFQAFAVGAALSLAGSASAGYVLYDIDIDGGAAWQAALAGAGKVLANSYDFDLDPDYAIAGFDGPLTSAGGGPVSPGILPDKVSMSTPGIELPDLVAVGPSAGFGNSSNAILANFFVDTFQVVFDEAKTAYEFEVLTLLGGTTVDLSVDGGAGFFGGVNIVAPDGTLGRRWGILATDGSTISTLDIADVVGGGAEGVAGYGATYIPAPGALALLGLAGLCGVRRRRS